MKKAFAITVMLLLVFLAACESKTTGKRVAIPETSAPKISGEATATVTPTGETGKSAAETLKELQSNPVPASGAKSGTFYPPVTTDATGKEALAAKTRALMTQGTYNPDVAADSEFGAKYHDSDGDAKNLPGNYSDNTGD